MRKLNFVLSLVLVFGFLFSVSLRAETLVQPERTVLAASEKVKALRCKVFSQYIGFSKSFNVLLEGDEKIVSISEHRGKTELAWSVSECEDNSSLTFDKDTYAALLKGDKSEAEAKFEHEEPDFHLESLVRCKLVKMPVKKPE